MRHRTGTRQPLAAAVPRRLFALALVVAIGAVSPAWAADDGDQYDKTGVYLTAMGLYAIPLEKGDLEDSANRALGAGSRSNIDNSLGASGRLGYRLHPRFAIETQFEFLSSIEVDAEDVDGNEKKSEINFFALTGNAKAFLLTGRFQPYLAAGAGWSRARFDPPGSGAKSRHDGFATRLGAGFDLYGSEDIALSTEVAYVLNTGKLEDLDYLSIGVGLTLRFFGVQN